MILPHFGQMKENVMIIEPRQATGKECCENCIHGIKTDIDGLIDCKHDGRSKDCDLVCDEYETD